MKHFFLIITILLPFYVSGQLQETFDGPEVTSTYSWLGNTERFIINAESELQLKGYAGGGEEMLYLSAVPLYGNEWHGKARSEYKGTTGNYFRFFLWCEKPDLDSPGQSIYVRMGYSKANIALCYQRGNVAKTTLIEGRPLFTEPREVEFKAIIDEDGECILYSRCSDEEEFYEEGRASIPLYDGLGYYMIGVKYSSQHAKNKYIDDLYIKEFDLQEESGEEPVKEPEPPLVLEETEQENGKELLLYFNRPVIAEEANFILSELGEVDEIYQSYDELILKLVWEEERTKGKEYTLYYDTLFDEEGNECDGEYTFVSLFGGSDGEPETPEPSGTGSIRFNEIMADPSGLTGLPETEYVELYNTSAETISLKGWTFVYGDTRVALADADFPGDSYLVLYREGRAIAIDQGGREMPLAKFPAQLANTGKRLQLFDPSNHLVDEVTYEKAKAAQSWEWSEQGWYLSEDQRGGTPGSLNSIPSDDPSDPEDPEDPEDPTVPSNYERGSILINEVMANPTGAAGLPETEYVELWNTSSTLISLKGWSFSYDGKPVELADLLLAPDRYILLFREGRELECGSLGALMPLAAFPAQLANTGKSLALLDPSGAVIDETIYATTKPGISWEREGEEWYLSTDERGGTPGEPNSDPENPIGPVSPEESDAEPFDIVFNELLPNPYADGSEYIELYNRSGRHHSLSGLSVAVRKADGTLSTAYKLTDITPLLPPGGYALLTKEEEGVSPYYSIHNPENIYEVKLPVLNNNGSALVLFRTADEVVIDEVTYSSKWHHSAVREEKGVALERIDPDGETQDAANWTSAAENAGYGTPGYRNSQYLKREQGGGTTGIEKPEYSHQTGLYSILYSLDQPGYRCRAFIYNLSGHRVAEVANNELIGTSGELLWDGSGHGKTKLPPGPYIFYLELYHGKGITKTYKEVFLVY